MKLTKKEMCGRGRQHHRWVLIPVQWEPDLWYESYNECINEECTNCHKIKASMWNDRDEKLKPRYKHGTGVVYDPEDEKPTPADYWQYQRDKARQLRVKATAERPMVTPEKVAA